MPRFLDNLNDAKIRNAKAAQGKPHRLFDGRGLFLQVMPQGGKWWRFKYRFAGKEKLISLGVYPDVGLKEARTKRDEARRQVAAGIDPSAERKSAKAPQSKGISFETVAREWLEKFSPRWVPTHTDTVIQRLEANVFPSLGRRPINEITAPELLSVLRQIEARGAVSVAHRTKQIAGQVFRYAIATGRASRDPTADLRGALPPERGQHFGALTKPNEIAQLMQAIDAYAGGTIVKCALRFAALTFCRPGELRGAEWTEIDFEHQLWRIGAHRMKGKRDHLVPLSRQALGVLQQLQPLTGSHRYIFPAARTPDRPMSENTITAALRTMGYVKGQMTGHGFRTTASTLLNEMGTWSRDAIERQLAHAERDEVRGAYNRAELLEERRKMMNSWANYLDKLKSRVAAGRFSDRAPALRTV